MRFYKKINKKVYVKRFAWFPKKIFGQYERGYGQMGTVWLEFYWEIRNENGSIRYELC